MLLPKIAITMGDPAGIGPEVCLKAVADARVRESCQPVIFGDADILQQVALACHIPLPKRVLRPPDLPSLASLPLEPSILDFQHISPAQITVGQVNAATGGASYRYIEAAIDAALRGQVDAVTTGPIHKEALHASGVNYPGHTEIFAAKTKASRSCMMLTSRELTCSFVTAHVGYGEVPSLLSVERILEVIELSADAMLRIRGHRPKLLICGLNPHAGEHGLFGESEEERFIAPAVHAAHAKGIDIEGPLPPDTVFLPARRREVDCVVCMYHDQGHIPLKTLAFDIAVNTTLGLPIVRTSVDHGTALDIAGKGKADATSMVEAILLATKLTRTDSARQGDPVSGQDAFPAEPAESKEKVS